jgi:hypothetical protein
LEPRATEHVVIEDDEEDNEQLSSKDGSSNDDNEDVSDSCSVDTVAHDNVEENESLLNAVVVVG